MAASPDDDANLEVVRIAKAAGVVRVIGVAGDPERVQDYKTLDVPVFSPNGLAARNVELELEPRRVASSAFAGGKAEAVEVYIAPDASVAGKRLKDLHAHSWVVAAVLRGSDLIVPHGDTRLEAGDRVTVVGAAADYQAIVAAFTSGVSRFPLAFGRKVVVGVTPGEMVDGLVEEAARLVRDSRADVLTVVVRSAEDRDDPDTNESIREVVTDIADGIDVDFRATDGPIPDAIVQLVREENVGVVVVPGTDPGTRFARFGIAKLLNTYGAGGPLPILLARSRGSYKEVIVPARRSDSGEAAARAAIDLARNSGVPLTAVAVVAPAFVATRTDTAEEANLAMAWLTQEAAVHGLTINRTIEQGNPVRVMAGLAGRSSLLVMSAPPPPIRPLRLGISALVAARVSSSVLLVPIGT